MSRYPFSDHIEEYIQSCGDSLGNGQSRDVAVRHLRSIGRILHQMKSEGIIDSDNPSQITVRDIQSYAERRRSDGASESTVRRDLGYLNGYLLYLDNDSATVFQEDLEEQRKEFDEQSSLTALRRIMDTASKPERLNWAGVEAFSFVMLVIVLGIRPEQLRKAYYVPGQASCVPDHFIEYVDDRGESIRRKVRLDRMPVVERMVRDPPLDLKIHSQFKRPLFPSGNPLFDFASPNDVRMMKKLVERTIGSEFDYRICQRLYVQMKAEDEEPRQYQSPSQPLYNPYLDRRQSIIGKVGNLLR
jgi:hypothetical protein